jgi:hypothetical protein
MTLRAFTHVLVMVQLVGLAAVGNAQEGSALVPGGSRIRVHTLAPGPMARFPALEDRPGESFTGTFVGLRPDTLVVDREGDGDRLGIPIASIASLEASLGRHSRAGRGAVIGLLGGAAAGVVVGLVVCANGNCESSGIDDATPIVASVLGLGGAVAGAGIGAGAGAMVKTERWRRVSLLNLHWGIRGSD